MIDFWNFVIAVTCALVLAEFLMLIKKEERRKSLVTIVCAFIIGMAFHSILLHERIRHGWKFPWNHEVEPEP